MSGYLQLDAGMYKGLYEKGRSYMETKLYDGEYFIQEINYKDLNAPDPAKAKILRRRVFAGSGGPAAAGRSEISIWQGMPQRRRIGGVDREYVRL